MYGDDPFLDRSGRRSVSTSQTMYGTNYTVMRDQSSVTFFIPWPTECPAELVKYLNQENNTSNIASDVNVPPNPPDAAQARIGVFPIQM